METNGNYKETNNVAVYAACTYSTNYNVPLSLQEKPENFLIDFYYRKVETFS